ncbi:MAG: CHAT domain-containing protein [Thermodesulfobacteriota bacterium]
MSTRTWFLSVMVAAMLVCSVATAKEKGWTDLNMQVAKHYFAGDDAKALSAAQTALKAAESRFGPDHPFVASALNDLGALHKARGDYSTAEKCYSGAVAILEKAADAPPSAVAHPMTGLADVLLAQGKYSEAAGLYERAIQSLKKNPPKDETLIAHPILGFAETLVRQGKHPEAEARYREALDIMDKARRSQDPVMVAPLSDLAEVCRLQKKYRDAEAALTRAVAILDKDPKTNKTDVARTAGALVALYHEQGKTAQAKNMEKKVLAAAGGDGLVAKACFRPSFCGVRSYGCSVLGAVMSLGTVFSSYPSYGGYRPTYSYPGYYSYPSYYPDTYQTVRSPEPAWVDTDFDDEVPVPTVSHAPARPAVKPYDAEKLRELVAQAREKHRQEAATRPVSPSEPSTSEPVLQSRRADAAQSILRALKTVSVKEVATVVSADPVPEAEESRFVDETNRGRKYEARGDFRKAAQHYQLAIALTESLRAALTPQQREHFLDWTFGGLHFTAPYEGLARSLMKTSDPQGALRTTELAKAQVFVDSLTKRQPRAVLDVPEGVLTKDNELTDKLIELKARRPQVYEKKDKAAIRDLETEIKKYELDRQDHVRMIRQNYPLFGAVRYPETVSLTESALRPDEWVVSYDVTDIALLVYLTKGKEVVKEAYKPIGRAEVDELVRNFRQPMENLTAENLQERLKAFDFGAGKKLADLLLSDVLPLLNKGVPVIIVPDDSLTALPFEMLVLNEGGRVATDQRVPYVVGAEFFGDRNPVSYYQSIAGLTVARTHSKEPAPDGRTMVVVDPVFSPLDERMAAAAKNLALELKAGGAAGIADVKIPPAAGSAAPGIQRDKPASPENRTGLSWPRLSMTGRLGQALKDTDPGKTDLYEGLQARKSVLMDAPDLTTYRRLVFGTHGYLGTDIPGLRDPVLVFSLVDPTGGGDGYLRPSEVMGLKMSADMVALTACQTGLKRSVRGGGSMGMGQAFRYAGAKTVLMSLWSVEQSSAVTLVELFFKHLNEGKSKPEALKLARDEIRKNGKDHPFFWSSFILVGEAGEEGWSTVTSVRVARAGSTVGDAPEPPVLGKDVARFEVKLSVTQPRPVYKIGQEVSFRLAANRECHVYVFDVGTEGAPSLIFPNKFQPSSLVRKDSAYRIPSLESRAVLRLQGPEGTNRIKAFASVKPLERGAHAGGTPEPTLADIEARLAKDDPNSWSQAQIELKIEK